MQDVHMPGGVMICSRPLVGAGCEKPRFKPSGVQIERPMSSSALRFSDVDDAKSF